MRLWALIVTYNRQAALAQSLPRMLAEAVDGVLVVDNASTDGTGDWLARQDDPRLTVLRLAQNLGGAGGFEAGLRMLTESPETSPPDWICLLDDDAWPEPGAMAAFRARNAQADPDAPGPAPAPPLAPTLAARSPARFLA